MTKFLLIIVSVSVLIAVFHFSSTPSEKSPIQFEPINFAHSGQLDGVITPAKANALSGVTPNLMIPESWPVARACMVGEIACTDLMCSHVFVRLSVRVMLRAGYSS